MEAFRFAEFKGSARAATPRGEWVSDSGSLYPTLDVANTVDVLTDNIRSKVATMTGFKEQATQVPHLMRLFRLNGGAGPTVPYDEFIATLAKLNIIGLQQAVSSLFDRYDFDGTGAVVTEQFVAMILQCVPDCGGAPEVRNGFAVVRRAVRVAGGLHGLRRLIQILERRADRGVLRRLDVVEALTVEMGAHVKEADYRPILVAYDTDKTELVSLQELVFGLRGALPRGRRVLVERAWQQLLDRSGAEGAAAIPTDALLASVDRSCAAFRQPLALHSHRSHDATGTGSPGSASECGIEDALGCLPAVTFADWLDYCKDLSAVLPRDSEFCALFGEAFGADTRVERAALVKPGSIEDLLRSGRGAHGVPDASATGRRPVEGLLGGGHAADSRFALSSSSRLAASLGGRAAATGPDSLDARPLPAMASLASDASASSDKARPHTVGPRAVLAPQLAHSLARGTLRM